MNNKAIKGAARASLKGKWGTAIGVYFAYMVLGGITGGLPEDYVWITLIYTFFVGFPLAIGFQWFYLDLKRMPNPSFSVLFQGFTKNYLRNFLTYFLMNLFMLLWTLLLIIPGIIKTLAYSMTIFILRDRPELSALQAITESRRMMDGKKMKLFKLMLSFIIYFIIPIILIAVGVILMSLGAEGNMTAFFSGIAGIVIGFIILLGIGIYVAPYYYTALAVFYDDIRNPVELDSAPIDQNTVSLTDQSTVTPTE